MPPVSAPGGCLAASAAAAAAATYSPPPKRPANNDKTFGHVASDAEMAVAKAAAEAAGKEVCRNYMSRFPKVCTRGAKCRNYHLKTK